MSIFGIIALIFVWHLVGMVVNSIIDDAEHTPMGWASMMPEWIPLWAYNFLWPVTLALSLVRDDD
jgi:hypothetical protein